MCATDGRLLVDHLDQAMCLIHQLQRQLAQWRSVDLVGHILAAIARPEFECVWITLEPDKCCLGLYTS